MKNHILILSVLILSFSACKNQKTTTQLITIDLTEDYDSVPFNLNDHASDIRVIRLESSEDAYFRYFNGYVGEEYVISFAGKNLLLFNDEGKLIHIIARQGNGPQEFTQIDAWVVDDTENYLIYHDVGKDYFYKYNLTNLQFEERIPFEDHGYINKLMLINDTTLSVFPGMFTKYGYHFFNQTFSGKIIGGVHREDQPHPGAWAGMAAVIKKNNTGNIIFQPSESDTVFKISGVQMDPIINFRVEKPQKSGDETTATHASYIYLDKNQLLLMKSKYTTVITPNSSRIEGVTSDIINYDLKSDKAKTLKPRIFEYYGAELSAEYLNVFDQNKFFLMYQAIDLKDAIKVALKSKNLSEVNRSKLKQLDSEISIEDNHIIVTGKLTLS